MERLLKGVGLDKAAQLEMSHISSYILSSVSSGSALTTCSPNTPVCAEKKRICILKPAIFVRASAELWDFCKKGVERKCIVMQNNQWCIHNAFKMWIYPVGRVHSTTDSLRIESKDGPKRILLVAVVIAIIVINTVTIIFHHHPFLLYELEPKNFTLETPPTWEKSLPHKKWQTNRNGVPSQRQRATFQIFLVLFFILLLEVIFRSIHPWTRRPWPPLRLPGRRPLLYTPLQHLEEEETAREDEEWRRKKTRF